MEPQSDLLAAEIHKHASASVSKGLGEQILFSALGARHSSMVCVKNILCSSLKNLSNVVSFGAKKARAIITLISDFSEK